ncbi:MAG: SRPBCC family protein [Chloroflexota bacterium]|nr:SRPBCC family protein [Chloroflexota bacterium]
MAQTNNSSTLTVTLPSDLEIVLSREFDAPRELVFEAVSKPEHLVHWWGQAGSSLATCEIDFRPGGSWRCVERTADGSEYGFRGEVREVQPPERIVQTFEYEGMPGHVSVETLVLEDLGGRTRMTVTSVFDSVEDRDGMLQSGMERGASESYDRLAAYLRTMA